MKSTLNLIWHWGGAERLARFGLGSLLALALTACASASQPVVTGPKVQTFYELMVKLKKGFDEGTLDTPEFYARELGYPLERPETLKVIPQERAPSRQVKFNSGELAGGVAFVGPVVNKEGRKHISFGSMTAIFPREKTRCVKLVEIQAVWGVVPPMPQVWGAHGPIPLTYYRYQNVGPGPERYAHFDVSQRDGCVGWGYAVGQYYE